MNIDNLFIEFLHTLAERFGGFLTPVLRIISLFGEKAWIFLLIAFIMVLRKRTRWIGVTAILGILIGFIIAAVFMKPFFMRMRPYTASNLFQDYWAFVGAYPDTGYSMPSGHTVGVTAFFVALYITSAKEKRKMIKNIGIISVILMIVTRCYFMHHYLSDCIVGVIIGFISAYIAKVIVRMVFSICKKNSDIGLFHFILNFDVIGKFIDHD